MSQYPSPYNPPPQYPSAYGYSTLQVDELAPAKRAALMMWIIGGVLLVCGLCCGALASIPFDRYPPEVQAKWSATPDLKDYVQIAFAIVSGLTAIPGLLLIVLAFFVRRGGMGATITSIVLNSIVVLFLLAMVLLGVSSIGDQPGKSDAVLGITVFAVLLLVFAILLFMLIGAVRAATRLQAYIAQHQSQYWQYQQNQQAGTSLPSVMPPPPTYSPPPPPPPAERDNHG